MRVIKGNLGLDVKIEDRGKLIQSSGLGPPKEFQKEKNQQKRPAAKKLIEINDEVGVVDDGDWEEARVPNISSFEKNENIKKARQERIQSKFKKPLPCNTTKQQDCQLETYEGDSYSSEEEITNSELEQRHMDNKSKKKEERGQRVNERALKHIVGLKEREEKIDCSDSAVNEIEMEEEQIGEDDGEDEGYKDCGSRTELQATAKHVLRHCEKIGKNLRFKLSKWGEKKYDEVNDTVTDTMSNFCTDLLNIRSSEDDTELLRDESFDTICPGLVLKVYQLVGVNWLKLLHNNKINGVLADDMGLGKTVQSIAFLGWLRSVQSPGKKKAHLIVVPASTLTNWMNELERFCPALKVVTYHGTQDHRADLRYDLKTDLMAGKVDIMLSTFNIFERESARDDRNFLYKIKFEYLIIDEAHCLKVNTSARFINLNIVSANHRLLLSGTPVQNNLSELLSLMSFLMPKVFAKIDIDDLLEGFGWEKKGEMPTSSSSAVSINGLRAMLAPFVLRRVKSDVLNQLVEKVSFLEKVQMTDFQREVYENILSGHARRKNIAKQQVISKVDSALTGHHEGHGESKVKRASALKSSAITKNILDHLEGYIVEGEIEKSESNTDLQVVEKVTQSKADDFIKGMIDMSSSEAANLFTALRKAANHPLLLRVRYKDEEVMTKIAEVALAQGRFGYQCNYQRVRDEIDKFSDFSLHQLCLEYPDSLGYLQLSADTLYASQKMQKLKEMLPRLAAEGRRMLLFSQWTRLLDLLEVLLQDIGMTFLRLDGSTAVKDRQQLINEFSAEGCTIPVFLLSTKAGGLGINLVAADTVIMHDLDFNPENDRQAETRAVKVYRLVTSDTVDEDIYEIGERKRKLTAAVLSDHHGSEVKRRRGKLTKGNQQGDEEGGDADIGAIGRILQRAMQRSKINIEEAASNDTGGGSGSVITMESTVCIKVNGDFATKSDYTVAYNNSSIQN